MLEDFGIAYRLLGVTTMLAITLLHILSHMERYYSERYPEAGFSVAWNQVEYMAHVLNLGAQQILKEFKQPIDKDTGPIQVMVFMVTAVSRLSFLCRKIRLAPKLRRLLEKVCKEKYQLLMLLLAGTARMICWFGPLKSKMLCQIRITGTKTGIWLTWFFLKRIGIVFPI